MNRISGGMHADGLWDNVGPTRNADRITAHIPASVVVMVDECLDKLEGRLLAEFQKKTQKVIEDSITALTRNLDGRIESVEHASQIQSQTLAALRDCSRLTDQKVGTVATAIEQTLSQAVPGFRLEPSKLPLSLQKSAQLDVPAPEHRAACRQICPRCLSTSVRRAHRSGLWYDLLRFFDIFRFRCRACRRQFYGREIPAAA